MKVFSNVMPSSIWVTEAILENCIWIHRNGKTKHPWNAQAKRYGREFVQIDRWFPSSKKCWVCGEINSELERGEREWECPYCHTHLLRDLNAALNILYEGICVAGSSVLSLVDFMHMLSQKCLEIFLSNCEVRTICMV